MSKSLNATAASLLGFLHLGPMTGWDLVVTAQVVIGDFWSLTQSQVYRELAAMAEAGLVTAGSGAAGTAGPTSSPTPAGPSSPGGYGASPAPRRSASRCC